MGLSIKSGIVAAAAVLASAGAWANSYTIVDLGAHHHPYQIDNSGQIAATHVAGAHTRAIELRQGLWHHLGADGSYGFAIDGDGDGALAGTEDRDGRTVPVTWFVDGSHHVLKLPHGATYGVIQGISNGRVAGNYLPPVSGTERCFIGDARSGQATDMGTFAHGHFCTVAAINGMGQVAGYASDPAVGQVRAFLWHDGTFIDLGVLPGGTLSSGTAINDSGHVVGYSEVPGSEHAFLWKDGAMVDIGISSRYRLTEALSVNNVNVAVGAGQAGGRHSHAVRFEDGAVMDLAKEVTNLGKDWKLKTATGINDVGVIVGVGQFQGHEHGFMLVPQ